MAGDAHLESCVIAEWSAHLEAAGAAGSTRAAYLADVQGFFAALLRRGGDPASPRRADLRSWLGGLSERRGARGRKRALSAVKSFYRWRAGRYGAVGRAEEVLALKGPRTPKTLPRPIRTEAALALCAPAAGVDWIEARDRAAFALMYGAGLRISETLGLRGRDAPPPATLQITGKGGRARPVPIAKPVARAVARYLELSPWTLRPEDALFRGAKGGPLAAPVLRRRLAMRREALGLGPDATPHALRHAFATDLLRESGDLRAIQELLGHARLSSTQIYTQVDEDHVLEAFHAAHPRGARGASREPDGAGS